VAPSKREKVVALIAAVAVALLVGDRYVLTPMLEGNAALEAERQDLMSKLNGGAALLEHRRQMTRQWQKMTAGGLSSNPSEAESRVLHAVRDWAQDARLSLSSVKPERAEREGPRGEMTVLTAGTGNMRAVARFLYLAETTTLPLRIRELQIGSRKEGTDDLSVQLKLSTLYMGLESAEAPQAAGGKT